MYVTYIYIYTLIYIYLSKTKVGNIFPAGNLILVESLPHSPWGNLWGWGMRYWGGDKELPVSSHGHL